MPTLCWCCLAWSVVALVVLIFTPVPRDNVDNDDVTVRRSHISSIQGGHGAEWFWSEKS